MIDRVESDYIEEGFNMSKLLNTLMTQDTESELYAEVLTHLHIVSGKIIACDPLVPHKEPFERTISPGVYPVTAWWHKEEQRIAAVELKWSEKRPVRWEMATRPGQHEKQLEEGHIFGYSADTGLGCFADALAIEQMIELEDRLARELGDQYISFYDNKVEYVLAEHDDHWGNLQVHTENRLNVVMFSSGYGDGFYASYFGISVDGEAVSLVTDFQLLV